MCYSAGARSAEFLSEASDLSHFILPFPFHPSRQSNHTSPVISTSCPPAFGDLRVYSSVTAGAGASTVSRLMWKSITLLELAAGTEGLIEAIHTHLE